MFRVEKSRTSLRQELRNPSGWWIVLLIIAVIAILGAIFGRGEWDTISTNLENRPKLIIPTPRPPIVGWSHAKATAFFTNYAVSNPPPVGLETIPGINTCWDYVLSQTGEAPEIVSFRSNVSSIAVPQGGSVALWSAIAGRRAWRFWENTQSVLGPC
mgnify:CR=1 FL=1